MTRKTKTDDAPVLYIDKRAVFRASATIGPCPNSPPATSAILYDRNCHDRNCFPTVIKFNTYVIDNLLHETLGHV